VLCKTTPASLGLFHSRTCWCRCPIFAYAEKLLKNALNKLRWPPVSSFVTCSLFSSRFIMSKYQAKVMLESLYGWQSVSMSWCRAHFVDVWPDIASFSRVWVWNLLSCLCGAPSLTRGRVCPCVSLLSVRVRITLRLTVSQSVSQSVLVSSPLCGRLTRYYFLFKSLGLEFVVLALWGALSDERPGLSLCVPCISQSHFTGDSQSASQDVLASSPLRGRLTRYCFLFKSLGLEFVVLSLRCTLSSTNWFPGPS
jgi:hypothetical protein